MIFVSFLGLSTPWNQSTSVGYLGGASLLVVEGVNGWTELDRFRKFIIYKFVDKLFVESWVSVIF